MTQQIEIIVPKKFQTLLQPARYVVFYGGRGSSKSHSVARYLIARALSEPVRILCAREFQNSINDSVHALLSDIIENLKLNAYFEIKNNTIEANNGSLFFFKGLAHNIEAIKSTEGVDIVWIEEAERVSSRSWDILIPTIRKQNSRIIVTFNPAFETDPTYQRFVVNPPPGCLTTKVNWNDNPHFTDVLRAEMEHCRSVDYDKYLHIWEGNTLQYSDAMVFKNKVSVEEFSASSSDVLRFGADWGFARDATALIRCFVRGPVLYIDYELYGHGIELTDLSAAFKQVPGATQYKILADNARPETISFLRNQGWNIEAAPKWQGSVEDGIEFMRGFQKIVIHPRCKNTISEFNTYKFKVDKKTDMILPVVVDENNHAIDAIRYALSHLIKRKTTIYDIGVI